MSIPPSYKEINVETELKDPDSLLNRNKRFLKARKENPALKSGSIEILDLNNFSSNLFGYIRRSKKQSVYIYLNFGNKNHKLKSPIVNSRIIVSTNLINNQIKDDILHLKPQEGIVII